MPRVTKIRANPPFVHCHSLEYGGEYPAQVEISHWGPHPEMEQTACVFESFPHQNRELDGLIIPPATEINLREEATDKLLEWATTASRRRCDFKGSTLAANQAGWIDQY